MAPKRLALITGANSGIGLELSKQLLAQGTYHVLMGTRSKSKGQTALQALESLGLLGTAELIELDVTEDETIEKAAKDVQTKFGHLDVLVNNAAIATFRKGTSLRERMQSSFDANATGAAVTGQIFAPLLKKSTSNPRIVNVSSGAGSISLRLGKDSPMYKQGVVHYRASKAAMNMAMACQVADYEDDGIKVFLYCPGHTVSNLGPYNTAEMGARAVDESVKPLVDIIEGKRDEGAGQFLKDVGTWGW